MGDNTEAWSHDAFCSLAQLQSRVTVSKLTGTRDALFDSSKVPEGAVFLAPAACLACAIAVSRYVTFMEKHTEAVRRLQVTGRVVRGTGLRLRFGSEDRLAVPRPCWDWLGLGFAEDPWREERPLCGSMFWGVGRIQWNCRVLVDTGAACGGAGSVTHLFHGR